MRVLLHLAVQSFLWASVGAQMAPPPRFSFLDRSAELLAAQDCDSTKPGFSLLVAYREQVLVDRYCGLADVERGRPVDGETQFYAASIGKTFTAAAVLRLIESKHLQLGDTLSTYFPEFPPFAERIRIYHLLTHTSGLPDHSSSLEENSKQVVDNDWVIGFVRRQTELLFEPGMDYRYSNAGYVLLAAIIEAVSGKSYSAFVRETFLAPLQLHNTTVYDGTQPLIPNRARGYKIENGGVVLNDYEGVVTTGSGAIFTTTRDLYKWYRALKNGDVLTARSRSLLFDAPAVMSGRSPYIAMGWFDETFGPRTPELEGMRAYGAIGMLRGYRAMLKFFPDDELVFVVLSNSGVLPVGGSEVASAYFKRVVAASKRTGDPQ